MSILIKGLHKPDENHGCPFVDVEYGYCLVDLGVTGNGEKCERMKECPLIELPDHGDLIDRDVLLPKVQKWYWEARETVKRMPTVIPAERSE